MNRSVAETPSRGFLTPIKRSYSSDFPAEGNKIQKKNVEEEGEWVTVYGFSQRDVKWVLREFEKCGWVLEHVTGSDAANWVHILYQNPSDAQIALSKSGMQMNEDVILGVKSVDPVKKQALNEKRLTKLASEPIRKAVDPVRIQRAFTQCLHLLHRSEADFFVLGETGNVYTVTLSRIPSCNCPDWHTPCKHMLFVLLRVLRIPPHDDCVQSKTLTQSQAARLLYTPTSVETLAGARACERFRYLFSTMSNVGPPQKIQLEIGAECPYCNGDLNEVDGWDPVVECSECGEVGHESCLVTSKMRRGGENCKSCRAHWSAVSDETRYLNLAAYVNGSEDDEEDEDEGEEDGDEDEDEDDGDEDDDEDDGDEDN